MAVPSRAPRPSAKSPTSRDSANGSDVWQLFLMEFERQEQLWDRTQPGRRRPDRTARTADAYEPLDKESVVRRLIALLSKEP